MKIIRLLEITILLLNRKKVTASEIAGRFGVSVRTVYRDIETLSSAGVPVYMSRGKSGGISLLENFTLDKTLLSENEIDGLLVALRTMGAARYPETVTVIEKIGALFRNNNNGDWIGLNFADWSADPNERNKFNHIRDAILGKYVTGFDYINAEGVKSSRFTEPEKLVYYVNAWYLSAYCRMREENRLFRLSRIKNVKVTGEHFVKRETSGKGRMEIQDYTAPCVELKLRFSEKALNRLYDDFDERLIRRNADGSFDVSVAMPENEWLYGYILSFGNNAEVIAPEHIRGIIQRRIKDALKVYDE